MEKDTKDTCMKSVGELKEKGHKILLPSHLMQARELEREKISEYLLSSLNKCRIPPPPDFREPISRFESRELLCR